MQGPYTRGTPPSASRSARRGRLPLAAACTLACTGAWAQNDPNPYYIGLSQAITHSTNINNVTDGPGDTYSSTGLIGGVDQRIGRQRVYGSGNVTLNRYRDFTQLNNTSYGLNAGLDWQTVGDVSGTVYTSFTQGLANQENNLLQQSSGRNLVRTEQVGTRANWGGSGKLTIGGGYGYSQTRYSDATLLAANSSNQTADIGVYFHPGETLTLGTALRYTRSKADDAYLDPTTGALFANRTNGRNVDFSASWRPTAQSGANARLSWTNQSNSAGGDGYSGLTGELGVNYMPTGKLTFSGAFNRDASTNGSFYNTFTGTTTTQPSVGLAANNSVSNSVSAGVTYSATAKVSAVASASYRRTTQDANGGGIVGGSYRDSFTSASLGVNWSIRRFWSASCGISRIERRLSGAFANDYSGTTYNCSTQVTLR